MFSRDLTIGDVCRIARVCRRTACKWCDAKMLESYTLPASKDRRIRREELLRFLRHYGMPVPNSLVREAARDMQINS